jgi:hypothetical protein
MLIEGKLYVNRERAREDARSGFGRNKGMFEKKTPL